MGLAMDECGFERFAMTKRWFGKFGNSVNFGDFLL
jgi:hypothetical protein